MKTSSCKAKGRRLQQHVVQRILETFPELTADDVRSTSMGCSGEDVQLSSRARELVPFSIEAKNTEKLQIWSAIEQATANAKAHAPLVAFKRNNTPVYATLPLDTLLALLARSHGQACSDGGTLRGLRRALKVIEREVQQVMSADAYSDEATGVAPVEADPELNDLDGI